MIISNWRGYKIKILSSCSSAKFDSFNPATSTLKWIITSDKK